MIEMIDELCLTGEDQDSTAVMERTAFEAAGTRELMTAWLEERGRSIESQLMLGRVRRLLVRVVADGQLTDRTGREAKRILRAIDLVGREDFPSGG